jgi:hypothetical protein
VGKKRKRDIVKTDCEVGIPKSPSVPACPPAKRSKKAKKPAVSGIQTKALALPRRTSKSIKVPLSPQTLKTYGARTRKAAPVKPASVDYDEIPGQVALVVSNPVSSSDPIAMDSPTKRSEPVTRSKVAGMNVKNGKLVTPAKPLASAVKGKKDPAAPKAEIGSYVTAKEPPRSVTPLQKSSTVAPPVLTRIKEDVAGETAVPPTVQSIAGEMQKTTKVESFFSCI